MWQSIWNALFVREKTEAGTLKPFELVDVIYTVLVSSLVVAVLTAVDAFAASINSQTGQIEHPVASWLWPYIVIGVNGAVVAIKRILETDKDKDGVPDLIDPTDNREKAE